MTILLYLIAVVFFVEGLGLIGAYQASKAQSLVIASVA